MTQLTWDTYAPVFAPVTTSFQSQMYSAAAGYLYGQVVDGGCGPCKLAPYLADCDPVTGYLGVDYSESMVQLGLETLRRLDQPQFKVQRSKIEEVSGEFHSAVSLQSYYSWDHPALVLRHLHSLLVDGGRLVLATANDQLDIHSLLHQASREWLLYPGWDSFADYNRRLAALPQGRFVSLDELVGELRDAGFSIVNAHTRYFQGGLSFVVAEKGPLSKHASGLAAI